MNSDELCEKIKENLIVLGVNKNRTLNDISCYGIDDIRGFYKDVVSRGHIFYFQNADLHNSAKDSYNYFLNACLTHIL